jgi:tRNA(fMet)-specific endonuclease VapC
MRLYMLDTNICIYVMRDRPTEVGERFYRSAGELCISTITLAELMYGAEKSARPAENRLAAERLTAHLDVLPFSAAAAFHYGQIRAELVRTGRPAGIHDMLIGAHARSEGLTIVTNNTREFERMPGLRIENWAS